MSIKLMTAVFERYPEGGGEMLVALKLADYADDDGMKIFPSVGTIASMTRQSPRAVQYQIRRMEKAGWLVLVAHAGGGRGKAREYRISPEWINGADIAPLKKDAEIAPIERVQTATQKGANGDVKGANGDTKGCKSFAPDSPGTTNEPSVKHQPARRAPRVALHGEILNLDLPDWLPFEVWDGWCEHREAKAKDKDAPWTMAAARVSIRKLEQLRDVGQPPNVTIDEAVLRGWTGLFPVNASSLPAVGAAVVVDSEWSLSIEGIKTRGNALKVKPLKPGEEWVRYKARVFKAAGPGPWMEKMLKEFAGTESVYDQLFAYFNDVRVEHAAA